ncbi:MAG: thiopurine S-methyltransferase, partial [Gammaproteobacteria bacterium]
MDQAFWHQKWANNEIGFHRDTVHSFLEKYWRTIKPKEPGS